MTDFEVDKIVRIQGTDYDRRRKLSTKDISKIHRLHKQGKSISEIAGRFKVSFGTVKYHLDDSYRKQHNQKRKDYAESVVDYYAQRISRVSYKRKILANSYYNSMF